MKRSNEQNEPVMLNLDDYDGPGIRNVDSHGKTVSITMTEKMERQHDRDYRAWLIERGLLIPAEKKQTNGKSV